MSFSDIKGHDNVIRFFKRGLESNKVASAYLFFGPDGVGKTLLAETLAKALNCLDMNAEACDKCPSCLKIKNKNHPDVAFVEDKEQRESVGIGAIRTLQEKINLKPYEGRAKVYIINDCHTMTEEAQNCLLKTLEEPPANSVIILITSKPEELLLTLRSRCKQIKFTPLKLSHRVELAAKEGFLDQEALFLSRLANSGIIFSSKPEDKTGAPDPIGYKNNILDEFNAKKTLLDEKSLLFTGTKETMRFAVSILESWFRDVLVLKSTGDISLLINSDNAQELKKARDDFSFTQLEEIIESIETARFHLERNVSPKMAFNTLNMRIRETKERRDGQ